MSLHCFKVTYELEKEHFLFLLYFIEPIPGLYQKVMLSQTFNIQLLCIFNTHYMSSTFVYWPYLTLSANYVFIYEEIETQRN